MDIWQSIGKVFGRLPLNCSLKWPSPTYCNHSRASSSVHSRRGILWKGITFFYNHSKTQAKLKRKNREKSNIKSNAGHKNSKNNEMKRATTLLTNWKQNLDSDIPYHIIEGRYFNYFQENFNSNISDVHQQICILYNET